MPPETQVEQWFVARSCLPAERPGSTAPADRVAVLARVLERDLRFEGLSNEQARREMSESMPPEYVDAFFRFFADGDLDESQVLPAVEDITGKPARTFEHWARAHSGALQAGQDGRD